MYINDLLYWSIIPKMSEILAVSIFACFCISSVFLSVFIIVIEQLIKTGFNFGTSDSTFNATIFILLCVILIISICIFTICVYKNYEVYSKIKNPLIDIASKECPICYEGFLANSRIYITDCDHLFHLDCIEEWKRHNEIGSCPICRLENVV